MDLAHLCMIIAALLPIGCAALAKSAGVGARAGGNAFDNRDPRAWLARQQGWQARANAAQANSFEALPLFLAAVLVAQQTGARPEVVNTLALAFIGLRVAYIACYLANWPLLRSAVWTLGLACSIALFAAARF